MFNVPRSDLGGKSLFDAAFVDDKTSIFSQSIDELLRQLEALESLETKAATVAERRNWRAAGKNLRHELRRLAPVPHCSASQPVAPRMVRRAGSSRSARAPRCRASGAPPHSSGDGDPDGDPPDDPPDDDAIAAMACIMGAIMPGDRDVAVEIVRRIRSGDSATRAKGVMQLALAVWAAGLDSRAVDCRDVCTILDTDYISSRNFPEVAIGLGIEYATAGPVIVGRAGGTA